MECLISSSSSSAIGLSRVPNPEPDFGRVGKGVECAAGGVEGRFMGAVDGGAGAGILEGAVALVVACINKEVKLEPFLVFIGAVLLGAFPGFSFLGVLSLTSATSPALT